ncbi:MAG TPA: sigma-70 family RNA polymerase sigma factor [Polyangiales bacterium]|nr:sigma-70 family RNA polymerase sigma factor [Polyangiales bacterium]
MPTTPLPREVDISHLPGIAGASSAPAESGWISRIQRGDPVAVEWLVREHWGRAEGLLVRLFGRRQDLEDLVQTTFLETLRALPNFRGESSLGSFVCGVAVRVGLRACRPTKVARSSMSLEQVAELTSADPSAEADFERAEALRRVQLILDKISEPKRVAFLLWAVEGLHVNDVADAMQASVPATRSRIFYAQKALKASAARDPYLRHWMENGGEP